MERKHLNIPTQCVNCTKEKMEAVYCPTFPTLEEELIKLVHCSGIGINGKDLVISGGKFNHSWKNLKPDGIKSAKIPGSCISRKSPSD